MSKSSTCSKVVFLSQSFLEVDILTTTYQKPFILRPLVPCIVDIRPGVDLVHLQNVGLSASKFPGSPCLDNHLSESFYTWTICSLQDLLCIYDIRPMSVGRARGQNEVNLQNVVFLLQSFLEAHTILTTTYQKAFILRPYVPCRVLFHSMTTDLRVHGQGWCSRSESSTSLKCGTSVFSRSS